MARRHPSSGRFVPSARPVLAALKQKPQQATVPPGGDLADVTVTNADKKFAASGERPQPQSKLENEVE
jgi:hypothetical protein